MNIINATNLTKTFGNNIIFKNLNFSVKKGEVLTIIGPSGQGKSTLLRCLIGLEKVDDGIIEIAGNTLVKNGVYCAKKEMMEILSDVGIVFQDFNLFPNLNVNQNLKIVCNNENKINSLLKRFQLYDKQSLYPQNLSGGQKQRLAIIRTLLRDPKIILLDEPTSALDKENSNEIVRLIEELKEERYTIIIVTHDNDFVKSLDSKIYVINQSIK